MGLYIDIFMTLVSSFEHLFFSDVDIRNIVYQCLMLISILLLAAHRHQIRLDGQEIEDVHLPPSKVPLSSKADFEEELPRITKSALEDLKHDKNHTSPDSIAGQFILQIAAVLLLQLPTLCSFLFVHLNSAFLDVDSSQLFKNAHQLRLNIDFINGFSDIIVQNMTMEIPAKFLKRFVQHFLTKFIASFLKRKAELIDTHKELEVETLSDNDNQVIFYICGYIIHALKKRYYKIKRHSKRDRLLSSLDNLLSTDNEDLPVSDWMKAMNRGGLKKPSDKFYKLMVQVEKWLRESVHTENLHQDSLISLKVKLMDYQLLNTCWDRIVTIGDDKLLLLDHVLALFLKVRGFALVKLVRKDICKKRKQSKTAAGTKKSLRRELKEMNKAN